ncbi:hypothetical protein C5B85_12585 [Pseudoclavibacter sp. AY1F1]|uniref:hypothetical protein n=1 Tax=Pseudoclavibacter sp. AY1F1 TaxID=2080583 RepID=UPI000CE90373|nr:hypothetical protein [Pseudoclavibacter sp. AY1F1]PPF43533.1 hypothetical protein C5B85_12585 [Pseudoclavibacter sp. AY1F1]
MSDISNSHTRRSVMRASAWSVPVLALAAAAPAMAASGPPCVPDPILSSIVSTLRATNTGAAPLAYTFTQVAGADPLTMYVTSGSDTVAFNPDVVYPWPNTQFSNGAEFTYTRVDAVTGTFSFLIPAGSFIDFRADSTNSARCTPSSVLTVTSVPCPLTYTFLQCVPI